MLQLADLQKLSKLDPKAIAGVVVDMIGKDVLAKVLEAVGEKVDAAIDAKITEHELSDFHADQPDPVVPVVTDADE